MSNKEDFRVTHARNLSKLVGSLVFCIMESTDHIQALEKIKETIDTMALADAAYKDERISSMHETAIDIILAVIKRKYPDIPFEDFVEIFG